MAAVLVVVVTVVSGVLFGFTMALRSPGVGVLKVPSLLGTIAPSIGSPSAGFGAAATGAVA
jgi:hypothetical protein